MSVLDRASLEQSPLADLHAIASELSIDDYRLLRRQQLIDAILARQDGAQDEGGARPDGAQDQGETRQDGAEDQGGAEGQAEQKPRRRRGRRGGAGRQQASEEPADAASPAEPERPEPPAASTSDRARFESLPARFPDEPFRFGSDDPLLSAVEALVPIGKGSRVTIAGPARAGKSDSLRRLAAALAGPDDLELLVVLVGVRPEEIGEWRDGPAPPLEALSFASPTSAQDRVVYGAIDRARSIAVSGGHAVVLLDTLDGLHDHAARRVLSTARRLVGGGSVTVIATASQPCGGETTVIKLDPLGISPDRAPALDLLSSGTLRAELLVGEEGAATIARARSEALGRIGRG
jgi:transcription termination factor Rho